MEWDATLGFVQDPLYSKQGAELLESQRQWINMRFELLSQVPIDQIRFAFPEVRTTLPQANQRIVEEEARKSHESLRTAGESAESVGRQLERAKDVAYGAKLAWQVTTAAQLFEKMKQSATALDVGSSGIAHVTIATDGSLLFEWQNRNRRFSLSLEEEKDKSFWYFLDTRNERTSRQHGTLANLDTDEIVRRMLEPI